MVYMIITLSIHYIRYVKMHLIDVISWYRPFVALLIQIDIVKNSIDT